MLWYYLLLFAGGVAFGFLVFRAGYAAGRKAERPESYGLGWLDGRRSGRGLDDSSRPWDSL